MIPDLPPVEVIGPWLKNKGDVLNLWSVISRLQGAAAPAVSSTLGLEELPADLPVARVRWKPTVSEIVKAGRASPRSGVLQLRNALALSILSRGTLHRRRFTRGKDLEGLLDCSGYAYGDAWTTPRMQRRVAYYQKLKEQRAVLILLPQALGPFENPEMRRWGKRLLGLFDLVYARDAVSYAYAKELKLPKDKLRLAPDITHLLNPPQAEAHKWKHTVCIVPNARMIDQTAAETALRYRSFLRRCIAITRDNGMDPVLLIHERNDLPLAEDLRAASELDIPIVDVDARTTKGILGTCYLAISSRYHAIVSALSQGTPVIGTSWSHKYDELFRQYDAEDLLVSPTASTDELNCVLSPLFDHEIRAQLSLKLGKRALQQKAAVESMWQEVEELLPFLARP